MPVEHDFYHRMITVGSSGIPLCPSINKPQPASEEGQAASWQLLGNGSCYAQRHLFGDHLLVRRQPGAEFRGFVVIFRLALTSCVSANYAYQVFLQ